MRPTGGMQHASDSGDRPGHAPRRWLAVGEAAVHALEATLSGSGQAAAMGFPGGRDDGILRAADVHGALAVLSETVVDGCVVSARVLDARPRAALRSLRTHLQAAPLLVFDGGHARGARQAAAALGVPVWGTEAEDAGSKTPPAHASSANVALEPGTTGVKPPDADAEAEAATPRSEALPRADALPPPLDAVDPGRFAEGCLERIGRMGALVRYILRTLSEATNASRISVMLKEPDREALRLRAGRGINETLVGKVRCSIGSGVAGRVAAIGRPVTGHGSTGGPRGYRTSAFVVLPLGRGECCEGVVNLTDLPQNELPASTVVRRWAQLCRRGGLALRSARRLRHARSLSSIDSLTTLANRRAFERALHRELQRARRNGNGLAVAILDIDHFKAVNDRFGHQAGDAVLVQVASRLQNAFRETDLVARWGGEEFAVLLPGPAGRGAGEARGALERARQAIAGRPFTIARGREPLRVTLSGGMAIHPKHGSQADTLVRAADSALYRAKDAGRNRIESA